MTQIRFADALFIRLLWAQSKVESVINPDAVDFADAESAAFSLGRQSDPDAEVPPLLGSVPELKAAFEEGQADMYLSLEISSCNWCQDGTGNPCPIHG